MIKNDPTPAPRLTAKEQVLYNSILRGMDNPGEGWLHELADESRSTNGVLGSLVKKGLVRSTRDSSLGSPCCYWVEAI